MHKYERQRFVWLRQGERRGGRGTRGRGQLVWHVSPIEFCIYHEGGVKRGRRGQHRPSWSQPTLLNEWQAKRGRQGMKGQARQAGRVGTCTDKPYCLIWVTFFTYLLNFLQHFDSIRFHLESHFDMKFEIAFRLRFDLFSFLVFSFRFRLHFFCLICHLTHSLDVRLTKGFSLSLRFFGKIFKWSKKS